MTSYRKSLVYNMIASTMANAIIEGRQGEENAAEEEAAAGEETAENKE